MAKNPPNDDARKGAVTNRYQVQNPRTGLWTKIDSQTGKFMSVKTSTPDPYKGITKKK